MLDDVLHLVRGEGDVAAVHKLTPLFALLAWQNATPVNPARDLQLPVPIAYAVLRLWFELGVAPAADMRPPRDGEVPRLLSLGGVTEVERGVERALARLRTQGLPWRKQPALSGNAVATVQPRLRQVEAERMALAVMVPISRADTLALARRLWVPATEKETSA